MSIEPKSPMPHARTWRFRILASSGAILLMLLLGEVVARVLVWGWMSPEKYVTLTQHTEVKGQFSSHAYLPYVLTPNYEDHNSLGFRGKEFTLEKKPGVRRVVCLGSSTTYGIYVPHDKAYPAQLEEVLAQTGPNCEVINAGVPGYTSMEVLLTLQLRVLPLEPDVVVLYEGRNDLFPQAYNNYNPDYSHYLKSDYCDRTTNYVYKPLFRISNLFMILATYKGDRLGWSWREEHPLYGRIRDENRPTAEELVANLSDRSRQGTYRNNVEAMVAICKAKGVKIVLCTMAFRSEKLATGMLKKDPAIFDALHEQVECNNNVLRDVASCHHVPLVETSALAAQPGLFVDDCHMGPPGYRQRAELISPTVAKLIAAKD